MHGHERPPSSVFKNDIWALQSCMLLDAERQRPTGRVSGSRFGALLGFIPISNSIIVFLINILMQPLFLGMRPNHFSQD